MVWTLLELIRMNAHIFLSFHVVRDGQGEEPAAPTLIRFTFFSEAF